MNIEKKELGFDNIVNFTDISIQKILKGINQTDLTMALQGADKYLIKRIFNNMSVRAASIISESVENFETAEPSDIQNARNTIEKQIHNLAETNEIDLLQGNEMQLERVKVLKDVDDSQLLSYLNKENPETIALVLNQMDKDRTANILSTLPEYLRNEVNSKLEEPEQA